MDFENDINVDSLWLISERAKTGKHLKIVGVMANGLQFLRDGKYFAIIVGDVYKKREVIPVEYRKTCIRLISKEAAEYIMKKLFNGDGLK